MKTGHNIMNKFDIILFFMHPKRWRGMICALTEQVPGLDKVIFKVSKSILVDMVLPIIILSLSLTIIDPTVTSHHAFRSPSSRITSVNTGANILHPTYHGMDHQFTPKNLIGALSTRRFKSNLIHISVVTILSPYVLSSLHQQQTQIMNTIVKRMRMWYILRIQADKEANECQKECIKKQTLIRKKYCDIYFPPIPTIALATKKLSKSKPSSHFDPKQVKVLLFFPGAFVDHTSYAVIANKLAARGIIVAVLSMEPLRIAMRGLGADVSDVERVMKMVENECMKRDPHFSDFIEWSLGGHSLGALSAIRLSPSVHDHIQRRKKCFTDHRPPRQRNLKIAAWALSFPLRNVSNLSSYEQDEIKALVLSGTNDPFCTFSQNKSVLKSFSKQLPKDHQFEFIKGGTHNNFSSYSSPIEFNGVSGLSRNKQHQIVVEKTLRFLQSD